MIKSIKRILNWAGKYQKRLYLGCICSFFAVWCAAIPIIIASKALDAVLDDLHGRTPLPWSVIWLSLFGIAISILLRYFFSYWKARFQESIGNEVAAEERLKIGDILKRVSLGYFTKNSAGDILTAITTDLSSLELMGMKLFDSIVNGYVNLLAILIMMLFMMPLGACLIGFGALLSAFFLSRIRRHSVRHAGPKQQSHERLTTAAIEYIHGLPVVKSFGQEGVSSELWQSACEHHKDINLKIEHGVVPNNCAHFLALKLASVALILMAGIYTISGSFPLSTFLLISMFAFMIFGSVEPMSDSLYMLGLVDASMEKLQRIYNAKFIDEDGTDIAPTNFDIRFLGVSFGYENQRVLHDISFAIPENTTTAIVGPSGSGKSTICNLITRFYDVDEGVITIGGEDVRSFTCDSLLRNVSMVFQNVYLFHDTIWNNIKFGKPDASNIEIITAAKKARCHDFIMALPNGFDTVVGEGGSSLSGGEKQRISIARAMLKDAPIVILDEATASIDPENEHLIQQAIRELVRDKTIVTIAHRLTTIKNADQILVLDKGHLVQVGTHEELRTQPGIYKDFIDIRERTEGWKI